MLFHFRDLDIDLEIDMGSTRPVMVKPLGDWAHVYILNTFTLTLTLPSDVDSSQAVCAVRKAR